VILAISPSDAERVLFDPEIARTISEDDVVWTSLPEGPIYLCGYVPELVGCFVIQKQNRACVDVHVQVLPKHRTEHAEDFGRQVIDWVWENLSCEKMTAQIPVIYPNVKDFAERMGFEVEGINTKSFWKGGKLVDQWYLGLCRS